MVRTESMAQNGGASGSGAGAPPGGDDGDNGGGAPQFNQQRVVEIAAAVTAATTTSSPSSASSSPACDCARGWKRGPAWPRLAWMSSSSSSRLFARVRLRESQIASPKTRRRQKRVAFAQRPREVREASILIKVT